jgi:hypothetical protein
MMRRLPVCVDDGARKRPIHYRLQKHPISKIVIRPPPGVRQ